MANQNAKDPFGEGTNNLAEKANNTPDLVTAADANTLSKLVQLLLFREGREVEKLEVDRKQKEARQKQHDRNAADSDSKYLLQQAKCKHLKGGKHPTKGAPPNYAVYQHTFINAETVIRCQVCGMRWRPLDTVEFLVRGGRKISNHTKAGWREACQMCEQSSNTPSSSEIPGRVVTRGTEGLTTDITTGNVVGVNPVDEKGQPVSDVQL